MLSQAQQDRFTAGALTLIALLVWAMAVEERWTADCLERKGVDTTAIVTDRQTKRGKSSTTYFVYFRFRDAAGREIDGRQRLARAPYEAHYLGKQVPARYCPGSPERNALDPGQLRQDASHATLTAQIVSAAFALILLFMWVKAGRSTRRATAASRDDDIAWTAGPPSLFRRLFR